MSLNQTRDSLNSYQQDFYNTKLKIIDAGQELLDLSMINPDIEPDREILDKLVEFSLKPLSSRYAVSRGIRPLREALSKKYKQTFGVELAGDREICVVQGSKDGLLSAFSSLLKPGDKVLLPSPCYPGHLAAAELAHLETDFYTISDNEEQILAALLNKINEFSPQIVMLNFPHNPTGVSVSSSFYQKLVEGLNEQVILINDFVYGEMNFNNSPAASLLEARKNKSRLLELFSLSKSHSLAGWRVGAISGDSELIKTISRYKSHVDYGIFLPIQFAAAAALLSSKNFAAINSEIYSQRADLLEKELTRCGFKVSKPVGGCSLWVKLPDAVKENAMEFCLNFLRTERIALSPGEFFEQKASRYFRVALVVGDIKLIHLVEKIKTFMQSILK